MRNTSITSERHLIMNASSEGQQTQKIIILTVEKTGLEWGKDHPGSYRTTCNVVIRVQYANQEQETVPEDEKNSR